MGDQELINEGYVKGEKSFEFLAKKIDEDFNWGNVHIAMTALNWCWSFGVDKQGLENKGVPDVQTLKNTAYRFLKTAYEDECQVSSGGFTAGWDNGDLFLIFTLETASSEH